MSPEAVELDIFIHGDFQLWKQHEAIEAMLAKKIVTGTYDPSLAVKGWLNLVDRAARMYARENNMPSSAFDSGKRREVASELERRFYRKHMGMKKRTRSDFEKNLAFMLSRKGERIMERAIASRAGRCEFCGGTDHASDDHSD